MSIFVFGIESAPIRARKVSDAAAAEKFVEHLAMDIVDVDVRPDRAERRR
jgi:hypothetical protein